MKIEPDNEKLVYCGRIDWTDLKAPIFVYPCTSVEMIFLGDKVRIYIRNYNVYHDNYLGYILDGEQGSVRLLNAGITSFEVETKRSELREHKLLIFKRQDACHVFEFLGLEIVGKGNILPYALKYERRIEVYGDSVSAGEVSEAVDYIGREDPPHNGEYSNSWYSYAWIMARKLNARLHNIAQGGIALMDRTGWFHAPETIGMETVWDKIHYNPVFKKNAKWDFKQYIPQVVIIAIGQNDSHPQNYMAEEYGGAKAKIWRARYGDFLKKMRKVYPEAMIICCTTLLNHDKAWDKAVGDVLQKLKDKKITQYIFKRCGRGTPGHLRIQEAQEMADELAAYIENIGIEGWN